ncbi:MAG TPA: hypothetical protein VN238_21755, partial [Solirubrobacteraceae bacterium]|nr:hypothetical protein [Solirubrobacteraceae bacterium]
MSATDPAHRALLATLVRHDVRFVLVGGVGLQLHGFSGATRDVDVTVATDEENGRRLDAALRALGADPFLTGERGVAYRTRHGMLEVLRHTDGVGDFAAWAVDARPRELERGVTVLVGSPADLVRSKEGADRPKDRDVLPQVRAELLASGALREEDVRG